MRLAKILGAVGRTFITAGLIILLFVGYQLWGTGIREAQAQEGLEDDFTEILESAPTTTAPPDPTPPTTDSETVPTTPPAVEGAPIARIEIPTIGVDKIVVEGISLTDLKKGPGHFPQTPMPGQQGNAAIAGHRTTYGAPFNRIDELVPGDEIFVTTLQGKFRYLVSDEEGDGNGNQIVAPTQVEVLQDFGDNRLTLQACHPKYSARQRIIVVAKLAPEQQAQAPSPRAEGEGASVPVESLDDIDGEGAPALPAVLLGLLCALIWLVAWIIGRVWRRWPAYLASLPIFLVALFFFFEEFSRLLPSSF